MEQQTEAKRLAAARKKQAYQDMKKKMAKEAKQKEEALKKASEPPKTVRKR